MVCQACLAKEPWNRPTAQQLADFAARHLRGENPPVTWAKKTPDSQAPVAKEENPVPAAASAPSAAEAPAAAPKGVKASPLPVFAENEKRPERVSYPAWVWAVVPMAGLIVGFLVKLLVG